MHENRGGVKSYKHRMTDHAACDEGKGLGAVTYRAIEVAIHGQQPGHRLQQWQKN